MFGDGTAHFRYVPTAEHCNLVAISLLVVRVGGNLRMGGDDARILACNCCNYLLIKMVIKL